MTTKKIPPAIVKMGCFAEVLFAAGLSGCSCSRNSLEGDGSSEEGDGITDEGIVESEGEWETPQSDVFDAAEDRTEGPEDAWETEEDADGDAPETPVTWSRTFDLSGIEQGFAVGQSPGGGYIVAAHPCFDIIEYGVPIGFNGNWFFMLDPYGHTVWSRRCAFCPFFIPEISEIAGQVFYMNSMHVASGGEILLAGCLEAVSSYALAFASDGRILWWIDQNNDTEFECFNSFRKTSDGGYIAAGPTHSWGAGGYDMWVLKLDSGKEVEWQKTYGTSRADSAVTAVQTQDGGYIVGGNSRSRPGSWNIVILKLSAGGDPEWMKLYGGANDDYFRSFDLTDDGGIVVAGMTTSVRDPLNDAWILKLDAGGDVQWQAVYGGPRGGDVEKILQLPGGGYLAAGRTDPFGSGLVDAWLFELDASGGLVWEKTYGDASDNWVLDVEPAPDGGFIVTGGTSSPTIFDAWVLKTDEKGSLAGTCPGVTILPSTSDRIVTSFTPQDFAPSMGDAGASFTLYEHDPCGSEAVDVAEHSHCLD